MWAIILVLAGGVAYYFLTRGAPADKTKGGSAAAGRGGRAGGGPTPVSVAAVRKGDIGVYINALGTVTPVYNVTVTSRVTGQLMEIYYREGEIVQKGALLALIDPRPYQAAVTQAQGQLERDTAALKNAQIDFDRYKTAFQQHAIPEQQLATQQALVNQDAGTVKVDEGNLAAAQINVTYTKITAPITGRIGLRAVDPGNVVQANGSVGLTITQLQPITVIFAVAEDYLSDIAPQLRAGHKLSVEALDRSSQIEIARGTLLTIDNQIDTTTGTVRARATFANSDFKLFPNEFVNIKLLVKTLKSVNLIPTAAIQRNQDEAFVYVMTPGVPHRTTQGGAENSNPGGARANAGSESTGTSQPSGGSAPPGTGRSGANAEGKGRGRAGGGSGGGSGTVHSRDIQIAITNGETSAVTGVNPGEILITDGFDRLQEGSVVQVRPAVTPAPVPGVPSANKVPADEAGQTTGVAGKPPQPGNANPTTENPGNANPNKSQGDAITGQPQNANQPRGAGRKTNRGQNP